MMVYTVLGREQTERFIERGIIEIAPLAYMRGRTLEDAFVILMRRRIRHMRK